MDYRFLVFGVLVIYVAIQAHAKPYILASDNALEQCTLIALMLIIFLDIGTAIPIFAESDKSGSIMSKLQVRTVAVLIITVLVFVLVMAHKSANAKAAKLAKIGVVTTSKVFLRTKADKHDDDVMDDPRVSDHENSSRKAANKAKKERIETENSEIILRHGLTEAEVKQYRAAFAVFDDGDTGTVDAAELGHLFTMMGQAVDNIQEYMKEFDGDGSGKVRALLRVGIIWPLGANESYAQGRCSQLDFTETVALLDTRKRRQKADEEATQLFGMLTSSREWNDASAIITVATLERALQVLEPRQGWPKLHGCIFDRELQSEP